MNDDTNEAAAEVGTDIPATLRMQDLPALKQPLADGIYGGIITMPDGQNVAVAWLHNAKPPTRMSADAARAWAKSIGAQLISRAIGSLLVSTLGELLPKTWVWTSEDCDFDSAYAWNCYLGDGIVISSYRSADGGAVAVRLIPLTS